MGQNHFSSAAIGLWPNLIGYSPILNRLNIKVVFFQSLIINKILLYQFFLNKVRTEIAQELFKKEELAILLVKLLTKLPGYFASEIVD